MGRVCVEISDDLEKKLRIKAIEDFGGRKGDLSRAVEEAVKTWVAKKQMNEVDREKDTATRSHRKH